MGVDRWERGRAHISLLCFPLPSISSSSSVVAASQSHNSFPVCTIPFLLLSPISWPSPQETPRRRGPLVRSPCPLFSSHSSFLSFFHPFPSSSLPTHTHTTFPLSPPFNPSPSSCNTMSWSGILKSVNRAGTSVGPLPFPLLFSFPKFLILPFPLLYS